MYRILLTLPLCLAACAELETTHGVDPGGEVRVRPAPSLQAKADGACGPFPANYYRYLDDTACTKQLPSNRARDLTCPTAASHAAVRTFEGHVVHYWPADVGVEIDPDALKGLVPDDLRVTVILVRRVDGVPHYRYLSNGRQFDVVEPWSTTKFMAAANAAARLRIESDYRVGLTGEAGGFPLGDLVTMIHAYDERRFTSNGLARYFHDVSGRARAQGLISTWLKRPPYETFGGNYGAPVADVPLHVVDARGSVSLPRDRTPPPPNQLSTFTLAEFLKRLVMHREDASTRLPGIQWADVSTLLYGAQDSALYSKATPQGMEADTAIYLQQAFDVDAMERRSQGQCRIFSKLGHGPSRGGEFTHVGYACLPALDETGKPIVDVGKEFVIATHLGAKGDLKGGDARLAAIYRVLTERILDGRLK